MKHGPIALIDEDMPVVVVCPRDAHYEKTLSNMQEVKAREGQLIAVCTAGDADVAGAPRGRCGASKRRPAFERAAARRARRARDPRRGRRGPAAADGDSAAALAYYVADLKGTDVDQPRNLAKTVTVE